MHAVLLAASRSLLPNREGLLTRDDLYQEGWTFLGYAIAYYRSECGVPLEKWTLIFLLRRLRRRLRQFREGRREVEMPEELVPTAKAVRDEEAERRDGIDVVSALTRGLKPDSAELFRLRYLEGQTRPLIAKAFGIRPMAVTERLQSIRSIIERNAERLIGAA